MVWSKLQASDKLMCVVAIIGGIISLIESGLHMLDLFEFWSFGIIFDLIALVLAIIAILLGIKPVHYTPSILVLLGLFLIIFGSWIGGIVVLIAALIGILS
ncbi:MAG: hypothetical protein CEE43_12790 [Promethearchaeota archaeon Loki_b32]|nr:MAG: hypothetical protein CEE43_12790 [Candidatus Lokiarchaeota archaeon Loki_b32]